MQPDEAIKILQTFQGNSLKERIADVESLLKGRDRHGLIVGLEALELSSQLLGAALSVKALVGQINVVIHVAGILAALPKLLDEDERIEFLSLGAGNTGRDFDLETDRRVAEFKFINWRGGSESIRQNMLFKDFFELAEYTKNKARCLYVIGRDHPLKFLGGNRSLDSVMSKNASLKRRFEELYRGRFKTVGEYFDFRQNRVEILDLAKFIPDIAYSMNAIESA